MSTVSEKLKKIKKQEKSNASLDLHNILKFRLLVISYINMYFNHFMLPQTYDIMCQA